MHCYHLHRYRLGDKEYTIKIRGSLYKVDFQTMKQYNVSTGIMRNVQRNPIWKSYHRQIVFEDAIQVEEVHEFVKLVFNIVY